MPLAGSASLRYVYDFRLLGAASSFCNTDPISLTFLSSLVFQLHLWSLNLQSTALSASPPLGTESMIAAGTPMQRPKIADSIVDLVGGTPMVRLQRLDGTVT